MSTHDPDRAIEGTIRLIADAVEHGSRAVEQVQLELAARPLELLQQLPVTAAPARAVQAVHAAIVRASHELVRVTARATRDAVVELAQAAARGEETGPGEPAVGAADQPQPGTV